MKRLSLFLTLACITTSTFAQTVTYGSSGLNQTSTTEPILFKNNGNEKVRIGSDGNVGIGTNAPTEKLEVIGNLKVSGTISSTSSSPTIVNILRTGRIQALAGDSIVKIGDSTINVNTKSNRISFTPASFGVKGLTIGNENSGANGLNSIALGTNVYVTGDNALVIGSGVSNASGQNMINATSNSLYVGFNSKSPTLFVGSSAGGTTTGNVGIGTTSTHAALTIKNGLAIDAGDQNDGTLSVNSLKFGLSTTGEGIASKRTDGGNRYGLDFYTSNSNRMSITNDGNVGLGTTAPSEKLQIGDRFVFHNGGTKVLGYNFRFDGQEGKNKRLVNDYSSIIAFSQGEIALKTAVQGASGTEITFVDGIVLKNDGSVGIGTSYISSGYKLAVNGKIIAEELMIKLRDNWPDYVFSKSYKLYSTKELKEYIDNNKHLPNMPSAKEVAEGGISIGDIVRKQTEKIEELTLYIIELQKQIDSLKK